MSKRKFGLIMLVAGVLLFAVAFKTSNTGTFAAGVVLILFSTLFFGRRRRPQPQQLNRRGGRRR